MSELTGDFFYPFDRSLADIAFMMKRIGDGRVFPKISFQEKEGQEIIADMGVEAFMRKNTKISVQYIKDVRNRIYIKSINLQNIDSYKKSPVKKK